jgi:hypothetical protein
MVISGHHCPAGKEYILLEKNTIPFTENSAISAFFTARTRRLFSPRVQSKGFPHRTGISDGFEHY